MKLVATVGRKIAAMITLDDERATIAAADGPVGPLDPNNSAPLGLNRDPRVTQICQEVRRNL
jgi:hypothetical protein